MPGNVPPVEGERANLLAYLEQQRYGIRLTAFGLTDDQARATPATQTSCASTSTVERCTRSWRPPSTGRNRRGCNRGSRVAIR